MSRPRGRAPIVTRLPTRKTQQRWRRRFWPCATCGWWTARVLCSMASTCRSRRGRAPPWSDAMARANRPCCACSPGRPSPTAAIAPSRPACASSMCLRSRRSPAPPCSTMRSPAARRRHEAESALAAFGVDGGKSTVGLSGGETRRAALARAFCRGSGRSAARRADQPPRHPGDRDTGGATGASPRGHADRQPRPRLSGPRDDALLLAGKPAGAANGRTLQRLRRLVGKDRGHGGRIRSPSAEVHRARARVDALRRHRAPRPQRGPPPAPGRPARGKGRSPASVTRRAHRGRRQRRRVRQARAGSQGPDEEPTADAA